MSKSAANGTAETTAAMRASACVCQVSSSKRCRITPSAIAFFSPSSQPPLSQVMKPTHDEKSSPMRASQWRRNWPGDQRPPARLSMVWPPAEPPKAPTLSSFSRGAKRGSAATASMARDTSAGRRFQLSGPGVLKSPVWSPWC